MKNMIETKRLILREMTENDYSTLYTVLADSDIMKHYPYTFDENRVRNWIKVNMERYRIFGFGLWAVCLKDTGEMIGDCGLTMQSINGLIRPEIGYHIRKDKQRNGYATEAAKAVRDWAFENTPFQILYSYMTAENIPSIKTAKAYGCRLVDEYENEQNETVSVYAISKKSWKEKQTMPFDFKKEYKEFYMPKARPEIVTVPKANYIAIRGKGNPNDEDGTYKKAIGVLYAIAYTIKMSKMGDHRIDGYYDYVVPPLEGFWWQEGVDGIDYRDKATFCWISVIRLPDFVTKADFDWAVETATQKKKLDCTGAEFLTVEEGLCVQIMHIGSFDNEPETVALMDKYIEENGYANDFASGRLHHEIYMSDARKVVPEKWKTVIRHPIKKR